MDWITLILTGLISLTVGYLLGYLNHGLAMRREARERVRKFRTRLRAQLQTYGNLNTKTLFPTFQSTCELLREGEILVEEDISFWKRRRLKGLLKKVSSRDVESLKVPSHASPKGANDYYKEIGPKIKEFESAIISELKKMISLFRV